MNSYNSGLLFLYGVTLDINLNIKQIPRHRKQRKFPDVLTQQEIQTLIICSSNYWNMTLSRDPGDVQNDAEGVKTFQVLGKNMATLLKQVR